MIDAPKNKLRAPIFPLNARTLVLTSLGLGFLRPAPGTWGSLPPPVIVLALWIFFEASTTTLTIVLGALLLVSSALCVAFGRYAETRFGRKDAAEVVLDETAGQCLPLMFLPIGPALPGLADSAITTRLFSAAALCGGAFLLFRVFDILKPWPARRLESLPHGWGILADDLIAGLYAAAAMQLATRLVF